MGLSLDGIASGMPTTDLIKATMDVERLPQLALKARVELSKVVTTALQDLNSKFAQITQSAEAYAKPDGLAVFTATSSSEAITVKAGEKALAGELDVTVNRLATKHAAVTAPMADFGTDTLTLTRPGADPIVITGASSSLDDMVTAINVAGAGVTATKVATSTGDFRLQFTATDTGAENTFDIETGGSSIFTAPGAVVIRQGMDAQLTMYAGTDAEQAITSASNTFEGLLPGVSVTVNTVTTAPVSLSVSKDADAISKKAENLIEGINGIFGFIKLKSEISSTTDAEGKTVVTSGIFLSDSTIRTINQELMTAATAPVNGRSPSEIGMEITKDGLVTYNEEKFKEALAKDPVGTEAMFAEIASRVAGVGKNASDKYDGQITSKINGQESQVREMNDRIISWDTRLASREASLKARFAAMEVAMSKLNASMSSLMSSVDSFSNGKSDK